MSSNSSKPTIHFQYPPFLKVSTIAIYLLFAGSLFFVFVSMLLGYIEFEPYQILHYIIGVALVVYSILPSISSATLRYDGLQIKFIFFGTKFVSWPTVCELRVRGRLGRSCSLKYDDNSVKHLTMFIGFKHTQQIRLVDAIIDHAQLNLVGKNTLGTRIYKREEAIDG